MPGVAGTWRELTDNVNLLAGNLTNQVRNIALVTTAVANGDLSQKITVEAKGEILELKNTINMMVEQLRTFASEVTRVAKEVGTEGKLGAQADVKGVAGTWKDLTDNVNLLAGNLTNQVRNIALVTTAVANGDLSQKITVEAKGEILELKNTINTMVEQLRAFAAEVTRVAREVGTEGKLGGQAEVQGRLRHVEGPHRQREPDGLATSPSQVRGIAKVVTAVANGDLSQKFVVEAKGEIAALADTINSMIESAPHLRRRGDDGRARGRHRRQARRAGQGAGRRRNVEGPHRQREPARRQPDQPGAQHRARHDRRRQRRPLAEDHRRGQGRDPRAQEHHQHHGRAAAEPSPPRSRASPSEVGTEGKLGGQAEVPGVVRHLEGPHRQRELHGLAT